MFAAVLVLIALAGGAAGTYFLMDEPRRRARRHLAALRRERRDLEDDWGELEEAERRFEERRTQLAAAVSAADARAAALAAREAEFGRRVVSYDELAAENGILRGELRTAAVHAAYLEQAQHAGHSGAAALAGQRDRLGRAYFEEAVAAARKALTPAAYPALKQRVRAAAARARAEGADLPPAAEDLALADLHALFERAARAAAEREEQARIREQMREELARQREVEQAEAEAERAEREREAAAAALAAALRAALSDAAGKHEAEVDALRARLAEAEARAQRTKSLAQQTRAGYVYVISNVGSFGPGVFKIGMTRRLEPLDRVYELGDASVPFPFDVHMMIRCDDAPALEAALHRHFHARRVNRVNPRKEFFRVTIEEIIEAVREHHGEVEYTADAEALEYMSSRDATDADVAEIDAAFAGAAAGPTD
jgi:hypothetical protein